MAITWQAGHKPGGLRQRGAGHKRGACSSNSYLEQEIYFNFITFFFINLR